MTVIQSCCSQECYQGALAKIPVDNWSENRKFDAAFAVPRSNKTPIHEGFITHGSELKMLQLGGRGLICFLSQAASLMDFKTYFAFEASRLLF